MAIHSDKNLYPGINAHLNSFLQHEAGGWRSFHAEHIIDLCGSIDRELPANYYVRSQFSLQGSEFEENFAEAEDSLIGLVIYQMGEQRSSDVPITRIELLSPANKPGGSHYEQYILKRQQTLESGLRLVEIDDLHETPPIIDVLPDYSKGETDAYPYIIIISDPRPTLEKGLTKVYAFHVAQKLPKLNLPLAGADVVKVDFGAVYNHTFESSRFFLMIVDYEQNPTALERYSEKDRAWIEQHLAALRNPPPVGDQID